MSDAEDILMHGGAICTMDPVQPWASAMALRAGRVLAVGNIDELRALMPAPARTVDLRGGMVMPGLVDVHNHFVWAGRAELHEARFAPDLPLGAVLDQVRAMAARTRRGEWIVGGVIGGVVMAGIDAHALAALDEAADGHPVMLRDDSHHNRWVSSAALALAGIAAASEDPPNGEIARDPTTGNPTGLLKEAACMLVEAAVARAFAANPAADIEAAAHAVRRMNAYGITAVQEALTTRAVMAAVKGLEDRGQLTAWVVGCLPMTEAPLAPGEAGEELLAMRATHRSWHFRPDAGKIFLDGVPPARTAAMLEPYRPDAVHGCCFRGGTTLSVPQLARALADAERRGIPVKIHCAGDAAVRLALDAIEVLRSFNGPGLMHQIAHASFVDPAEVPRFAQLNVLADLSPMMWFPGPLLEGLRDAVPAARLERFWPVRDLMDSGALIACGSDWPVVPDPDPWAGIQGLVTRQDPRGALPGSLWPEQAISLMDALKAYTINSVRALGLHEQTGSLAPGKSADCIVLDRDLFEIPAESIAATRVVATLFEGRLVHGALP